jgi:hypothetical protein
MKSGERPSAVLLAAGAARRFGRLKQLEPVGPNAEALLDYAIHDALNAGFGRIVLVTRSDIDEAIRNHVAARWTGIVVEYVHQTLDVVGLQGGAGRQVPWGTGHAVLSASGRLDRPFAVANADDFYGRQAWADASAWLHSNDDPDEAGIVAYRLDTTLSDHGGVSRAVCGVGPDGTVETVTELLDVRREGDRIRGRDESGQVHELRPDCLTSMNLWALQPSILSPLDERFTAFARSVLPDRNAEFRLSTEMDALRRTGRVRLRAIATESTWIGVTYAEDGAAVRQHIARLVEAGHYPERLGADQLERTG